ncbi:MAG TPA: hypothetical protein VMW94_01275, partial [Actinomycetes bacterium]|nr:hypothetical protein [Actinomycetes bacterium]
LYLGPGGKKVATVGGGNAVIGAGQHRLDGTEHLAPADTTTLDATASAHGLLPKLSGDAGDALLGDGTWGVLGGDVATDAIWDAAGDLAVGSGADTAAVLTVGSNDDVLTVVAGVPAWSAPAGVSPATTIESETTLGVAAAVGSDAEYARQDHTHGTITPAVISAAGFVGEMLVADGTSGPSVNHSEYVEMTTQRTTTSASLVDITGVTADIEIQREAHIAVWLNCHVSAGATCDLDLAINFDGTDEDVITTHLTATDEGNVAVIHRTTTEVPPGTYTVKGRFARSAGGGTPAVERADFLVMSMGQAGPVLLLDEAMTDYIYSDIGA